MELVHTGFFSEHQQHTILILDRATAHSFLYIFQELYWKSVVHLIRIRCTMRGDNTKNPQKSTKK